MTEDSRYTIGQLAEVAAVTPRTIRYYATEGLLPQPLSEGRYARYTDAHLNRLRLIQRLKHAFLPLDAIRMQLGGLTDAQVLALLASCPDAPQEKTKKRVRMRVQTVEPHAQQSSEAYIAQILAVTGQSSKGVEEAGALPKPRRALLVSPMLKRGETEIVLNSETGNPTLSTLSGGAVWERILLAEGAELHLRVPDSPEAREQMERLIAATKALFAADMKDTSEN